MTETLQPRKLPEYISRHPWKLTAGLLLVPIAFYSLHLAAILLSLWLTYIISSYWMSNRFFPSQAFRLILTPFLYVLILQCVVICSWALSRNFPLDKTAYLGLAILAGLYAYLALYNKRWRLNRFKADGLPRWSKGDSFALAITGLVLTLLTVGHLLIGGIGQPGAPLVLLSGNVDDAAHLAIFNDRLQFNRGVIYLSDTAGEMRNLATYPSGWHAANAVITEAAIPSIQPGKQSLDAYTFTKVAWFAVLVFVFARTVYVLLRVFLAKTAFARPARTWLAVGTVLTAFVFLVDIFADGFYSYIPQLTSLFVLTLALLQGSLKEPATGQGDNPDAFTNSIPLLALAGLSGSLTWLLLFPAAAMGILILAFRHYTDGGLAYFKRSVGHHVVSYLPLYLLLLGALFLQFYSISADPGSIPFLEAILMPGGTPIYSVGVYTFVALGILLSVVFAVKESRPALAMYISILLVIAATAFVVYLIQVHYSGQPSYYSLKILTAFVITALPLALIGYAAGIQKLFERAAPGVAVLAVLLVPLLLMPQIVSPNTIRYLTGFRYVSMAINDSIIHELGRDGSIQAYNDRTYTMYYTPRDGLPNDFATMMLKSNKPNSACFNSIRYALNIAADIPGNAKKIKQDCQDKYQINLVVHEAFTDAVKTELSANGLASILKVQTVDERSKL